jgi:hypothetical protein
LDEVLLGTIAFTAAFRASFEAALALPGIFAKPSVKILCRKHSSVMPGGLPRSFSNSTREQRLRCAQVPKTKQRSLKKAAMNSPMVSSKPNAIDRRND